MTDYIIRDMALGGLLGSPFNKSPFNWHGTTDECRNKLEDGLEYRPDTIVLQKVYEIEDLHSTGEGSVITYGDPVYDDVNDKVTRSVTLSKTQNELDAESTKWMRDRAQDYVSQTLAVKGVPASQAGQTNVLGLWVDMMAGEIEAIRNGAPPTQEFLDFMALRTTVKTSNPK